MTDETTIQDRIDRARERADELSHSVVSMDPMVVMVDSEHSDSVHTVVPDVLHCSCEDHTYRNTLCYHLIYLADGSDMVAEQVRQAMTDELTGLQDEEMRLRKELREIASKREQLETVRESLDVVLSYSEVDEPSGGSSSLRQSPVDAAEPEEASDEMVEAALEQMDEFDEELEGSSSTRQVLEDTGELDDESADEDDGFRQMIEDLK